MNRNTEYLKLNYTQEQQEFATKGLKELVQFCEKSLGK